MLGNLEQLYCIVLLFILPDCFTEIPSKESLFTSSRMNLCNSVQFTKVYKEFFNQLRFKQQFFRGLAQSHQLETGVIVILDCVFFLALLRRAVCGTSDTEEANLLPVLPACVAKSHVAWTCGVYLGFSI